MSDQVVLVIAVLLILQIKHYIGDFVTQTSYQSQNKGTYGHRGGLLHAAIHAVGSMAAFLVIVPSPAVAAAIVVGEFIAHYHIDWLKAQTIEKWRWEYPQPRFWRTFGADQGLHQLTYLAIAGVLATQIVP